MPLITWDQLRNTLSPSTQVLNNSVDSLTNSATESLDLFNLFFMLRMFKLIKQISEVDEAFFLAGEPIDAEAKVKLISQLETILAEHWNEIKKFYPKIAFPRVLMLIECRPWYLLGQYLYTQRPEKTVYQYLMPPLIYTQDTLDTLEKGNIEDYSPEDLISSDDNTSLIPVYPLLLELNLHNCMEWDTNPFASPFQNKRLTGNEKMKLFHHCRATYNLYQAHEEFNTVTKNYSSVGAAIKVLAEGLRRGGISSPLSAIDGGGFRDTHGESAGSAASEAIQQFMLFWQSLPEASKIEVSKLVPQGFVFEKKASFGDLITVFEESWEDKQKRNKITTQPGIFECVENYSSFCEDILQAHYTQLYTLQNPDLSSTELIKEKIGNFFLAKEILKAVVSWDPSHYTSYNFYLSNSLSEDLKTLFPFYLKNITTLKKCLQCISHITVFSNRQRILCLLAEIIESKNKWLILFPQLDYFSFIVTGVTSTFTYNFLYLVPQRVWENYLHSPYLLPVTFTEFLISLYSLSSNFCNLIYKLMLINELGGYSKVCFSSLLRLLDRYTEPYREQFFQVNSAIIFRLIPNIDGIPKIMESLPINLHQNSFEFTLPVSIWDTFFPIEASFLNYAKRLDEKNYRRFILLVPKERLSVIFLANAFFSIRGEAIHFVDFITFLRKVKGNKALSSYLELISPADWSKQIKNPKLLMAIISHINLENLRIVLGGFPSELWLRLLQQNLMRVISSQSLSLKRGFIENFPQSLWKETLSSYLYFVQLLYTPDLIALYVPLLATLSIEEKLKQFQNYRNLSNLLSYLAELKFEDTNLYENLVDVALPAPIWKEAFTNSLDFLQWLPIWKKISTFEINSFIANFSPEMWAKLLKNEKDFKEVCHFLSPDECFFLLKYLLKLNSHSTHQSTFNFKRKLNIAQRINKINASQHRCLLYQLTKPVSTSVLLKNKKRLKIESHSISVSDNPQLSNLDLKFF